MKLIKRALATTAAVMVGGTMFAGVPANAAGAVCDGTQVKTCINVRLSDGGKVARGAARITDMSDGVDFQVKTTDVTLQFYDPTLGKWRNIDKNKDHDGWHDGEDLALTRTADCTGTSSIKVRAKARFDWKRAGSDYEWATSKPVNLKCR